jgi:hypothetical protein
MAQKYDAVVEVVRYNEQGMVELARGYERRGPAFGDRVLLTRAQLIERLKGGKTLLTGVRTPMMAGTFKTDQRIQLVNNGGKEYLVTGEKSPTRDNLQLPLF